MRLGFHSLRHSVLSAMARRGTAINTLRDIAGHANIATTAIYLNHVGEEEKLKAVQALPMFSVDGELNTLRRAAHALVDSIHDINRLRQAIAYLEK